MAGKTFLFLFVFLLLLTVISKSCQGAEVCKLGYIQLADGKCYMIVLPSKQTFGSWAGASTFCALSGGKLAVITMANKQALASRVPNNTNYFYYADGNDVAQEGLWLRNKNQEVVLLNDPIWTSGQPDNAGGENCGSLWNGGYNDAKCEYVPNPQNTAHPALGGVFCEQVFN